MSVLAKQTADIDLTVRQPAKADVAIRQTVHFQVGFQWHLPGVSLKTQPAPSTIHSLNAPASCENQSFS